MHIFFFFTRGVLHTDTTLLLNSHSNLTAKINNTWYFTLTHAGTVQSHHAVMAGLAGIEVAAL